MADDIPTVDFSPLSLSVDWETLSSERRGDGDLKSASQQIMNALTTFNVARITNTGLDETLVSTQV